MKKRHLIFSVCAVMLLMVSAVAVNAASMTATLNSSNPKSKALEGGEMGERFYTSIKATDLENGSPTIETQAGRKMFNIAWHDSGKGYSAPENTVTTYVLSWDANGDFHTRATWKNLTSIAPITGVFSIYE